jgi:hypothetical protein
VSEEGIAALWRSFSDSERERLSSLFVIMKLPKPQKAIAATSEPPKPEGWRK